MRKRQRRDYASGIGSLWDPPPNEDPPATPVRLDDVFALAATFFGYVIWGGFGPCALVANDVAAGWRTRKQLPESLTLLRTALFFASRRERFVDYGGFGEDPDGYEEHHADMRLLLKAIREVLARDARDDENETVAGWLLEAHDPCSPEPDDIDARDEGWLTFATDATAPAGDPSDLSRSNGRST